ncbi:MAG: hypothetical protein IGS23_22935 [Rivularia sp. T60_A2020_040]|nr:hypothetical protein [Rivularia sp. T60_A2020_040]
MIEPHYPKILMSFTYREYKIEIERDNFNQQNKQDIYSAWVNYNGGYAVAVPYAVTPSEAISKSKQWIDERLNSES